MDDECAGCRARDVLTHITLDKSESQVDARRHSGGSPNRTIGNKDPIHFDYDLREASLQLSRVSPVRLRAPPSRIPASAKVNAPTQMWPETQRLFPAIRAARTPIVTGL